MQSREMLVSGVEIGALQFLIAGSLSLGEYERVRKYTNTMQSPQGLC